MSDTTEADTWRLHQATPYVHTIRVRRRDQAHYLALLRHTSLSGDEIAQLAFSDGLARRAKNACKQADINALDTLLQWQEEGRDTQEKET